MYPPRAGRLCFGADYNPEQWPADVWREDVALMRTAGVTMVTVGVFSWACIEPTPGATSSAGWTRCWTCSATTASPSTLPPPPPLRRPGSPKRTRTRCRSTGTADRLSYGSRQAYCPSSPAYRTPRSPVGQLAQRYRDHPALAMWHVNNEYGCHDLRCYCDVSAAAFRRLAGATATTRTSTALNAAWGTAFWSQRYTDWAQVQPPRATPHFGNPGQELDFRRFCSDALLALFTAERDMLHERDPGVPVTTNFMAGIFNRLDYWQWAPRDRTSSPPTTT